MTQYNWIKCTEPSVGDILRWSEPIWAAPNKPRGKPDQIGEQMITGELVADDEFMEFTVQTIEKLSGGADAVPKVKIGDHIRRKSTSIAKGDCHKLGE